MSETQSSAATEEPSEPAETVLGLTAEQSADLSESLAKMAVGGPRDEDPLMTPQRSEMAATIRDFWLRPKTFRGDQSKMDSLDSYFGSLIGKGCKAQREEICKQAGVSSKRLARLESKNGVIAMSPSDEDSGMILAGAQCIQRNSSQRSTTAYVRDTLERLTPGQPKSDK